MELSYLTLLSFLLVPMTPRAQHEFELIAERNVGGGREMGATNSTFCLRPPPPNQPDCKVSFREDSGWTKQFNATCIKPNVFLLPYQRSTNQAWSPGDSRRSYATSIAQDFLPPYVRFTCTANFPIDFHFLGNGGIEFLRVWKSVAYVPGTDTFQNQTLNVEFLMSPAATGAYIFRPSQNNETSRETSFFIFAEPSPEGPFLVTPENNGESLTVDFVPGSDELTLPCIVSNRVANIELFNLEQNSWKLIGNSQVTIPNVKYSPETGFTLSRPFVVNASSPHYQCRVGDPELRDIFNVTVHVEETSEASPQASATDDVHPTIVIGKSGVTCEAPARVGPPRLTNVFVRNPTEAKIMSSCLMKGHSHCGDEQVYHKRIQGGTCPGNRQNSRNCTHIPPERLHPEGLVVCVGTLQPDKAMDLEYFKGFDGTLYVYNSRALPSVWPPSALLRVRVSTAGLSTPVLLSPTELVTGVKYEIKCNSVEFPFVKDSQLLYIKYRNGTEELLADLIWWQSGKEMYLNPDMVQLECRDRLWTTNALYNSSTPIVVSQKPCTSEQFGCASGQCIRDTWRCDGDNDCMDSSDEVNCHVHVCKPGFFKCLGGQCIGLDKRCNNKGDCPDSSDESIETCSNVTCNTGEFKCHSGQCVLAHFLCDGDSDCFDKSDESPENCAKYFPTISRTLQNVTFLDGSPGELICDTAPPLPPRLLARIEWWRHASNITNASRLWRNADGSKLALKFEAAREEDAGAYICFAENYLSRTSLTFHVTVIRREVTPAPASEGFPCEDDLDDEDCILRICETRPKLAFCHHNDAYLELEVKGHTVGESTGEGLSAWMILLGILFLVAILLVPVVYIWKCRTPSNFRLLPGAVRFGLDDEVMLDRS